MRTILVFFTAAILLQLSVWNKLRADQLEMQNGERYIGTVVSLSQDTVVFQSQVLGRIKVPRKTVASLSFGTNAIPMKASADVLRADASRTNALATSRTAASNTNLDFSAALRHLGANTNAIQQIRDQILSTSPEASKKYNELISGLISGQLNLNDIRREAKSSADQLRSLKRDLGPEAGDLLDTYLNVLDGFLKETAPPNRPTIRSNSSTSLTN